VLAAHLPDRPDATVTGPGRVRRVADDAPGDVAADLAAELWLLAGWLGLDDVVVGDRDGGARGTLAPVLAGALAHGPADGGAGA
jgi:hypothetical protein